MDGIADPQKPLRVQVPRRGRFLTSNHHHQLDDDPFEGGDDVTRANAPKMTKYFLESLFALFALFAFFGDQVVAQNTTCENDGVLNSDGSSCDCQLGFGGSTCSLPACGGDIFQGTNRSIVGQPSAPGTPANLTANSCSCEDGWSGFGCNVCQSASACQTGFSRVNGGSSSQTSLPGIDPDEIQNGTLVCNTSPRVWAVGELSCSVIVCNPNICVYILI